MIASCEALLQAARDALSAMAQEKAETLDQVDGYAIPPQFALPLSYLRLRPKVTIAVCDTCGRWETAAASANPTSCRMKLFCDGKMVKA